MKEENILIKKIYLENKDSHKEKGIYLKKHPEFFIPCKDRSLKLKDKVNEGLSLFDSFKIVDHEELNSFFSYARVALGTKEIQDKLKDSNFEFLKFTTNVSKDDLKDENFKKGCFYGYISSQWLKQSHYGDILINNEKGIKALEREYLGL